MEFTNEIQRHTYSIPSLVMQRIHSTRCKCADALADLDVAPIQKIVITGCGYSYAAAMSIKDYLTELTRLPICVAPAIEVSRYTHECADAYHGTLLVAISNSGAVSRINEALAQYRNHGAIVVGMTANLDGEIKNYADHLLDTSSPSIGRSLPLRGYAMTVLALIGLGYTITTKRNCLDQTAFTQQMAHLIQSMEQLEQILPSIDTKVLSYVHQHPGIRSFEFVGSGYERGAAFLGKIEMMGQAGLMASDEDSEQWCHCNFFMAAPEKIGTILFLAKNAPGASRAKEALRFMLHLKRPVCLVTDDHTITSQDGLMVIYLPEINDHNAGLLEFTVPSLLTGYVCEEIGETYSRGFRDQWELFRDGCGTCQSEIVTI